MGFSSVDEDEALRRYHQVGIDCLPVGVFHGTGRPWELICLTCGSLTWSRPWNAWRNQSLGCLCSSHPSYTEEMVLRRYSELGYQVEPLGPFTEAAQPYLVRCLDCSSESSTRPRDVWNSRAWDCDCKGGYRRAGLYLVAKGGHLKIGLGREARALQHRRDGWVTVFHAIDLGSEFSVPAERAILRGWRKSGFGISLGKQQMPQGGYTETALDDLVTRSLAEDLILEALAAEEATQLVHG